MAGPKAGSDLVSRLPAGGVCSEDSEVQAEKGVWPGTEVWGYVGGAESPGVVTRGAQGGGWRELHAHSLGAEPGAGSTENREGSGEPQKLSVTLPDGKGAELSSVLRCVSFPHSWPFPASPASYRPPSTCGSPSSGSPLITHVGGRDLQYPGSWKGNEETYRRQGSPGKETCVGLGALERT